MSDNEGEAAAPAEHGSLPRVKRQNTVQTDVTVDAAGAAIRKLKSEGKLKPNRHGLPAESRYDMFECLEHKVTERKRKEQDSNKRSSTGRAMVNVAVGHTDNGYAKYLTYHVSVRAEGRSLADATKNEQLSHLCNNGLVCVKPSHIHVEAETINQRRKGCCGWLRCEACAEMRKVCKHAPTCVYVTHYICTKCSAADEPQPPVVSA